MDNQDYQSGTQTEYRSHTESAQIQLDGRTQVAGLDYKTAALLCYVPILAVNLIASLVFLNSEPKSNTFVRFHAMQSLVMMVAAMVVGIAVTFASIILHFIPLIGGLIAFVLNLAWLGVCGLFLWQSIVGLIGASKGEMTRIPYASQIAEERLSQ